MMDKTCRAKLAEEITSELMRMTPHNKNTIATRLALMKEMPSGKEKSLGGMNRFCVKATILNCLEKAK